MRHRHSRSFPAAFLLWSCLRPPAFPFLRRLANICTFHFLPPRLLFCLCLADLRPLGPAGLTNDIETNVARPATSTTMSGTIPTMPNVDIPFRLFFGAPIRLLHRKPLCAEPGRELLFAKIELRERMLVRTISRAVPNDVRDIETQRTGVRLALVVTLP